MRRCANFRICGIISAYTILKTQLYVEKYAICGFCDIWDHICGHMFSYNRYPYNCASVQRALLAPEILNESFLKCRYFTALYTSMLSYLYRTFCVIWEHSWCTWKVDRCVCGFRDINKQVLRFTRLQQTVTERLRDISQCKINIPENCLSVVRSSSPLVTIHQPRTH